jgi:Uma2 family endonuclease
VLVVEVLSRDDMTFDKLDFYTARGVRELLVVDWQQRSVRCFALQVAQAEHDRSDVLGLSTAAIVAAVDWPPLD